MEKAGIGFAQGGVVQCKMSGGFPRTVFTFYCGRPLGEALGEGEWRMRREEMYTLLTPLCWEVKT